MLIVNADDFGYSVTTTDPALAAYDEGLITSATAMVWMGDGERAGALARERAMPVGLHLNLTYPFRDPAAPAGAAELQRELTEVFDNRSWREGSPVGDRLRARVAEAIEHQLTAFRELFGEPTHIDGHHHVHVHPEVLECLPRELAIRPAIIGPDRLERRRDRRARALRRRFRGADACVSFREVHPLLGGSGLEALRYADRKALDVMVHAQYEDERQALRSAEWRQALRALPLGSYTDV